MSLPMKKLVSCDSSEVDFWWIASTSFGRYYPVNGATGGENVGAGVIPALTPQRYTNMWHGCGMITVTGVRAGINPAPTVDDVTTDEEVSKL